MIGHVECWRKAASWNSRFPDHLVDQNKRIKWEFWFNEDGSDGDGLLALVEADVPLKHFIGFHLPHKVPIKFGENASLPHEWLVENLSGVWQIFGANPMNIYFEFVQDAVHFKLRFYDASEFTLEDDH